MSVKIPDLFLRSHGSNPTCRLAHPYKAWNWYLFVLLLFGETLSLRAQSTYPIKVNLSQSDHAPFEAAIKDFKPAFVYIGVDTFEGFVPDSSLSQATCLNLLSHLRQKAYLSASIDEFDAFKTHCNARLHLGPMMRWTQIKPASPDEQRWIEAAGFREKDYRYKPINHLQLLDLQEKILYEAENNGYPFAVVTLDSVLLSNNGMVTAQLRLERNRFFRFGDLLIQGDLRLPKSFLPNYLGLHAGQPYSHERLLRIREQLQSLLFVESTANPNVRFSGDVADINLYLKKKRNSRFDFIIGLLPQPDNGTQANRLLLTGSLNAAFLNALNMGERIALEFERLRPETQKLDAQMDLPYLLGSPFGLAGRLNIFRRDSSWVDAQADIGVQYLLPAGNYIKFFWENRSSSLQKVDTIAIKLSRRLPPNLDLRQNGFGLEGLLNQLDYRFNPRKGWMLHLKGVAGFNNVLKNNQIENLRESDFNYASLYDTVSGRVTRYRLEMRGEVFLPLLARSTFKLGFRGGGIFSDKSVFNNEQYRLGGNKLLRGFDEESLFATRWGMATAEYRLLLGTNSYLSVFGDYAYLENTTNRNRLFLRPLGLGAGMNIETGAGIFGLSLAVGRRDVGQSVDFRAVKFHLGYVSLF
jgi:outer membrane protein assembly factor BamA